MSNAVKALEPKLLWSHFADIAAIPRPSEHEEAVIAHVKAWAADRGFEVLPHPDTFQLLQVHLYLSPRRTRALDV